MESKYNELNKYSSGYLFKAAVRNLFKKKAAWLVVSIISLIASFFVWRHTEYYYGSMIWWAGYLFNFPFFVLFIGGVAGIVSNIGRFSARKFELASTISGVILLVLMSIYHVIAYLYLPIDWSVLLSEMVLLFFKHIPLLIISLAAVLVPVMICSRKINKE